MIGAQWSVADLFEGDEERVSADDFPLARRMTPRDLSEFVGQEHLLGKGKILRRAIESDRIRSLILCGPPGSGKTALARIVARRTKSAFETLNAVTSGVKELRELISAAKQRKRAAGKGTIVFIDEIHRFNRAQQDALLPDVEMGSITLIGATTQNPFFSIVAPLLSRSRIFELEPLTEEQIVTILRRAVEDKERGFPDKEVELTPEALEHLARYANGDARVALNGLEIAVLTTPANKRGKIVITREVAEESIQKKAVVYDGTGDDHYDTASAFIKSLRGSDPDSALYWLAKMLDAGEDLRFIARRIVIAAAEDVGNADPQALVVAHAAWQVCEFIGMPEAQIPLAQAAVYVATAPKSNASYIALSKARKDVGEEGTIPVPRHLKGASYPGSKRLGRGEGYLYPHDYEGGIVEQFYGVEQGRYYSPTGRGYEAEIAKRLQEIRESIRKEEPERR
jgi:putative ATPase